MTWSKRDKGGSLGKRLGMKLGPYGCLIIVGITAARKQGTPVIRMGKCIL